MTPLSVFSRASDTAARISTLGWFMIVVAALIFVGVMALMIAAILRHRHRDAESVDLSEPSHGWLIWGGAILPTLVLLAVFVVSLGAMRTPSHDRPPVIILVTGHQWWWQLDYTITATNERFRTANELHIPAGRPVRVRLTSADVIHSFWVPRLRGKLDLIPGDTNDLWLDARQPGRYGGTCAEYCGTQHARMMLTVVADDSTSFNEWVAQQASAAAAPRDSLAVAGERVFMARECIACHTVRGTLARGEGGPDLTHVGSRLMLAAGTLPNTLGNLAGWIANPQALKPGVFMPTLHSFTGPELRAVAAYVSSLK